MGTLFHVLKAVVLSIVMFFSLRYLGFSTNPSLVFSLVPLVLGTLGVLTSMAYGLTGLVFVLACTTALFPNWKNDTKEFGDFAKQQVMTEKTIKTK